MCVSSLTALPVPSTDPSLLQASLPPSYRISYVCTATQPVIKSQVNPAKRQQCTKEVKESARMYNQPATHPVTIFLSWYFGGTLSGLPVCGLLGQPARTYCRTQQVHSHRSTGAHHEARMKFKDRQTTRHLSWGKCRIQLRLPRHQGFRSLPGTGDRIGRTVCCQRSVARRKGSHSAHVYTPPSGYIICYFSGKPQILLSHLVTCWTQSPAGPPQRM